MQCVVYYNMIVLCIKWPQLNETVFIGFVVIYIIKLKV